MRIRINNLDYTQSEFHNVDTVLFAETDDTKYIMLLTKDKNKKLIHKKIKYENIVDIQILQ